MNIGFIDTTSSFPDSILRQPGMETRVTPKRELEALLYMAKADTNLREIYPAIQTLQENPSSAEAMRAIYKMDEPSGQYASYIRNSPNLVEARNRMRLIRRLIFEQIMDGRVTGLNFAGGSADAFLEGAAEAVRHGQCFKAILTDNQKNPLNQVNDRACELGLSRYVSTAQVPVGKKSALKLLESINAHFCEVAGYFDYFDNEHVTQRLREIRERLSTRGRLIWSSVLEHNLEPKGFIFHPNVFNWKPMVYRTLDEMRDVASQAGFDSEKITAYTTPHKLHGILVCEA